ncbi:MAG: TetR/AcrR family transcriptional regulator [Sphingomonadaceae bacterium]|nr:TetR/AcrR family transcriptional regulator [Sphingomonadaceae bacterium]
MSEKNASPAAGGPGRPTDEAKTEAILDAGRALMFAGRFANASMDQIADAAGVSKVTLYKRFGDKTGLTEAMIRGQAASMTAMIHAANRDAPTLRDQLRNFGVTLSAFLLSERFYHVDAMLTALRRDQPGATRRFFEAGPGTMRSELMAILGAAADREELAIDDIKLAAEDLLSLWRGFKEVELRFSARETLGSEELEAHVDHAIDVFFRAYRAQG